MLLQYRTVQLQQNIPTLLRAMAHLTESRWKKRTNGRVADKDQVLGSKHNLIGQVFNVKFVEVVSRVCLFSGLYHLFSAQIHDVTMKITWEMKLIFLQN